eukprot:3126928-Amphidinium_carterae.1
MPPENSHGLTQVNVPLFVQSSVERGITLLLVPERELALRAELERERYEAQQAEAAIRTHSHCPHPGIQRKPNDVSALTACLTTASWIDGLIDTWIAVNLTLSSIITSPRSQFVKAAYETQRAMKTQLTGKRPFLPHFRSSGQLTSSTCRELCKSCAPRYRWLCNVLRSQQTESEAGERTVTTIAATRVGGRLSQAEVDRDRARDELSQFIEDFTTVQSEARCERASTCHGRAEVCARFSDYVIPQAVAGAKHGSGAGSPSLRCS